MKKVITILASLVIIVFMSSFVAEDSANYTGQYNGSESDPAQIKLIINADNTFYYQDYSLLENKLIVTGTWSLDGKKVVLKSENATQEFHQVWKFEDDGNVAKSRKGLSYFRLTKTSC